MRIIHMPYNIGPVTKIKWPGVFEIVNDGREKCSGVPQLITCLWILKHVNDLVFWKSFDVLHVHFGFEFESLEIVEECLLLVKNRGKRVVFTCWDLVSVHEKECKSFDKYISLITAKADSVCTITYKAAGLLQDKYNLKHVNVVPHGYVVPPESPLFGGKHMKRRPGCWTTLLFGANRANRATFEILPSISTSFLKTSGRTLTWATKPYYPRNVNDALIMYSAYDMVSKSRRSIKMINKIRYTDQELYQLVAHHDALLLPYLFGTHSGQLEMALDLGVISVISDIGCIKAQLDIHLEERPVNCCFFNWNDGASGLYAIRLLTALEESTKLKKASGDSINCWRKFRIEEHVKLLSMYKDVYNGNT